MRAEKPSVIAVYGLPFFLLRSKRKKLSTKKNNRREIDVTIPMSDASAIHVLRSTATRGQLLVADPADLDGLLKAGIEHEHLRCATGTPDARKEIVMSTKVGIVGRRLGATDRSTTFRVTSSVQSIAQELGLVILPFGAES
jgi:hypothetical protein